MKSIEGIVIIAQETRFQLLDREGVGHQFIISHACSAEPEQIADLQRTQAPVRVHYTTGQDVVGHSASRIDALDNRTA